MLLLASSADLLKIYASTSAPIDCYAAWLDSNTTATPLAMGRKATAAAAPGFHTIVAAPPANTIRAVQTLTIRNRDAVASVDVTVVLYDGTANMELSKVRLGAGWVLQYSDAGGFSVLDADGRFVQNSAAGSAPAAVNALGLVVLAADRVNNNAGANTMADVTGLSFPVVAGETYWFLFSIFYQAAATTTGSRWSISGPSSPTHLAFAQDWSLALTTQTLGVQSAYDMPAASNASSAAASALTGNLARIEGFIKPSSSGNVIARFASEVASSAITAKAGSLLQWVRTL